MQSTTIAIGKPQRRIVKSDVATPPKIPTHKITNVGAQQAKPERNAGSIEISVPLFELIRQILGILTLVISNAMFKNAIPIRNKAISKLNTETSIVKPTPVYILSVGSHRNGALVLKRNCPKSDAVITPYACDSK